MSVLTRRESPHRRMLLTIQAAIHAKQPLTLMMHCKPYDVSSIDLFTNELTLISFDKSQSTTIPITQNIVYRLYNQTKEA